MNKNSFSFHSDFLTKPQNAQSDNIFFSDSSFLERSFQYFRQKLFAQKSKMSF